MYAAMCVCDFKSGHTFFSFPFSLLVYQNYRNTSVHTPYNKKINKTFKKK